MAAPASLTVAQRRALAKLRQAGLLEGLVLVGGTAVAYHLGHRISNDLDLFSADPSFDLDEVRRRAVASLDAETISQSDATLKLRLSDAVVDVVRYPFPSLGRSKRSSSSESSGLTGSTPRPCCATQVAVGCSVTLR